MDLWKYLKYPYNIILIQFIITKNKEYHPAAGVLDWLILGKVWLDRYNDTYGLLITDYLDLNKSSC